MRQRAVFVSIRCQWRIRVCSLSGGCRFFWRYWHLYKIMQSSYVCKIYVCRYSEADLRRGKICCILLLLKNFFMETSFPKLKTYTFNRLFLTNSEFCSSCLIKSQCFIFWNFAFVNILISMWWLRRTPIHLKRDFSLYICMYIYISIVRLIKDATKRGASCHIARPVVTELQHK